MVTDESVDGKLTVSGITIASSGDLSMVIVPAEYVKDIGDSLVYMLKRAAKRGVGGFEPDYFLNLCSTRRAELWLGLNGNVIAGTMITMSFAYPAYTGLRLVLASAAPGSLKAFGPLAWEAIHKWATHTGASVIEAWGRPGWMRGLKATVGARPAKCMHVLSYDVLRGD